MRCPTHSQGGGGPGGPGLPPIEMPQVKIMGQKSLISSVSVSFSNFAYKSTHVYNNN